jgi:hypothetical protein
MHPLLKTARAASLLAMFAWLSAATGQAAGAAKLTVVEAGPPKELSQPIRSVLPTKAIRIADQGKPLWDFWFRKRIPVAEKPDADSLAVTTIKEGTLLGAVRVYRRRYDFKDLEIPPGVYLLRFGVQPEDGNHLGVSPTRTFALLVPAKIDPRVDDFAEHDAVVKASASVLGEKHPSTLNLQAVENPAGRFPRLGENEGGEYKVLCLRLPAKLKGQGGPIHVTFALVYEGKGQI